MVTPDTNLKRNRTPTVDEGEPPDIVKTLTSVYLDVEKHGVHPDSAFRRGGGCAPPLQKEG